ncbi:hypothetical protein TSOC_001013 [Tetrabaena socialis]|uniref:Uncharacterized protein n=1 Tax=Tetrabaena socialis TaxID=47790 RepID=A0A2J8AHW4_9CHLO|nr:hypothetical protein TSOC_001013 [Tetrabaena socialis]|eukprot:PNH12105.1 hypothetical protein TSOC_001013 [Tetrabaena socialis]
MVASEIAPQRSQIPWLTSTAIEPNADTGGIRVSRRAAGGGLVLLAASAAWRSGAEVALTGGSGGPAGSVGSVMDEADFQRENFKLREREYRYYADATPQLPRIPDLADNTGGLANPAYLNFIIYCLWKVVFRHVRGAAEREAFSRAAAADFLARASPPAATSRAEGSAAPAQPRSCADASAAVVQAVVPFLELLRAGGYICAYQLVLNSHPGSWPQDWMLSQPTLLDEGADAASGGASLSSSPSPPAPPDAGPSGDAGACGELLFQIKLHRPADILASVALRSEEGGAWPRTVSSCIELLLEPLGFQAAAGPPLPATQQQQQQQQQRQQRQLEVSEYFYQDAWMGPKDWKQQLLLFLGDPLEQVGVDFVPTTLVQNWRLQLDGI